MQSDQELIIMCKPPEPTVIQNKAAGFAGSLWVERDFEIYEKIVTTFFTAHMVQEFREL